MTLSTIDVQMKNGVDTETLERMGFEPGVAGWWSRTATRAEKLELVSTMSRDMKGRVLNLLVRDADAVHLDQQGGENDVHNRD
jgi:hypothetical protein